MEIVVSNKISRPLYEQISMQVKAQIMGGELKAGDPLSCQIFTDQCFDGTKGI